MPKLQVKLLLAVAVLSWFGAHVLWKVWTQPLSFRIHPTAAGIAVSLLAFLAPMTITTAVLAWRLSKRRGAATLTIDPRRQCFAAPVHPIATLGFVLPMAVVATTLVWVERVTGFEHLRVPMDPAFLLFSGVLTALHLSIFVIAPIMLQRPYVIIEPGGLSLGPWPFWMRRQQIGWDELAPNGPPPPAHRRARHLTIYRWAAGSRNWTPVRLPIGALRVDAAFLAYTIRSYVDNPERRAAIGTPEELQLLVAQYTEPGAPVLSTTG